LQHFHDPTRVDNIIFPHNQDARPPADLTNWPPALIMDVVYGCAAVLKWGQKQSVDDIQKITQPIYYDPTSQTNIDSEKKTAYIRQQATSRRVRALSFETSSGNSHETGEERQQISRDDAMELLMFFRLRSSTCKEIQPQPWPRPQDASRHKVDEWLQSQRRVEAEELTGEELQQMSGDDGMDFAKGGSTHQRPKKHNGNPDYLV
jgi:hypothetical protein